MNPILEDKEIKMRTIDISELVETPPNAENVIFTDGDTNDIITVIRKMDAFCSESKLLKNFSPLLKGRTKDETLRNVFDLARKNFQYKTDKAGSEKVKSSAWMLYYRVGDCKSYSITIGDILRDLNIRFFYRFVSFSKTDPTPVHVFVVAEVNKERYVLDAISPALSFNQSAYGIEYETDVKPKI